MSLDRQAELARLAPCPYRVSAYCLFTHSREGYRYPRRGELCSPVYLPLLGRQRTECGGGGFNLKTPSPSALRLTPLPEGEAFRYGVSFVCAQPWAFATIGYFPRFKLTYLLLYYYVTVPSALSLRRCPTHQRCESIIKAVLIKLA